MHAAHKHTSKTQPSTVPAAAGPAPTRWTRFHSTATAFATDRARRSAASKASCWTQAGIASCMQSCLSSGSLGGDGRLFAVPWSVLTLNRDEACVVLDVSTARLKAAPGFDRDSWPSIMDRGWREEVDAYYGVRPPAQVTRRLPV